MSLMMKSVAGPADHQSLFSLPRHSDVYLSTVPEPIYDRISRVPFEQPSTIYQRTERSSKIELDLQQQNLGFTSAWQRFDVY